MNWTLAWRAIISGERLARTEVLEHDIQSIMERAQEVLQTFETTIGENTKSPSNIETATASP